jgi:hypothetical protein
MAKGITMSQDDLRALLATMLAEHGLSLGGFGKLLAQTISADHMPFTKQYVARLRDGKDRITEEIAGALLVLGAMADGQSELQARARTYTVLATHDLPPNTVVLIPARQCALPGCRMMFCGHPARRYCSDECKKEARKRRNQRSLSAVQ